MKYQFSKQQEKALIRQKEYQEKKGIKSVDRIINGGKLSCTFFNLFLGGNK